MPGVRQTLSRVTFGRAIDSTPAWTPDGRRFVLFKSPGPGIDTGMVIVQGWTSEPRRLLPARRPFRFRSQCRARVLPFAPAGPPPVSVRAATVPMTMSLPDAGLWLVRVSPFVAMAVVVVMAAKALGRGELPAGGRLGKRRVSRARQPVGFWLQIGLHVAVALCFFAMGLLLTDLAPRWLVEWVEGAPVARGE